MHPLLERYVPIVKAIAKTFGQNCEVLLHDISTPEASIAWIENKHVTGRDIGSPLTDLGLYFLQSDIYKDVDYVANYETNSKDGKKLKSTSVFIKDDAGKIVGFLCINYDVSYLQDFGRWIDDFCHHQPVDEESALPNAQDEETFAQSLDELIDSAFNKGMQTIGKRVEMMQKNEKLEMVRYLHKHGVFLVHGVIDQVADRLNVSRYTIYNYLSEIKKDSGKRIN